MAVDPGAIRGCLYRNTYIWLNNGQGFWFYPTFVGRTSVSGFRWNGFFWMFSGVSLDRIESFTCF
ncbi:transporter [Cohnella rhizosphaerae]|uniref:Transporter n=1 Tax=Cohnella rhizosphaerae TaxID=1457232 RepID=A0A9X4KUK1_9BACL|nr:transporter [Cohnella rhizosphaerae]MDG0809154.1 transporter [Cohnella rhizosphaerae]